MTNTGYARTMASVDDARRLRRERHASSTEWEPLAEFGPWTPPSSEPWHVAAYCTADVDTGSVGQLRLRSSAGSVTTNGVLVSAFARNIRLGFQGVANVAQTIYVEGRRLSGTGGVRLVDAKLSAVSAPPAGLIVGGVPVGGGVAEVVPLVAVGGTAGQQTITSPAFSPPANHRLVVVARAERNNHATAFTWSISDTGSLGTWQSDAAGPVEPSSGNLFGRAICVKSIGVGATPPTNITVTVDAWSTTDTGVYSLAIFAVPDPGPVWLKRAAAFAYSGTNTVTASLGTPPTGRPVAVFFHESSDATSWQTPADGWTARAESAAGNAGAIILAANSDPDGSVAQATTSASPYCTHGVFLDIGLGGTSTTDVRSTFVSAAEASSFTILPTWLSPPAQPGDKVVLIGAGPGPSDVSSWSWTFPGTVLTSAGGGTYNPRVMATVVDYNAAGWTVAASGSFRAAAIALTNAVGLAASTPVQAFSPANPGSVAHDTNAVGLVVNVLNYTTASVLAPPTSPGTHTTVLATPLEPRQIHVAEIARSAAGTYDPGAATTGPGSEESTAFAIVAQPTASATFPGAPTIPTFNTGSAITLGTLSADIAAAVAAQPAGTHFKLIAGTYTNWSNVRPKTGNHFQSPSSGQAILSGTGKVWAFRAIDATGSSDNVTISCTGTGSIKIQDYGAGTTRAEYGAIQAQPTDTRVGSTEYTYGTAQGWYIHGVELSKNGAQGIRVSDYFTLHDVVAYGHTVSNVGGDRGVGGLMYNCTIDAGGLNPASGAYSNGAGAKFTFWNASEGRSQVLPSATLRPKAPIKVVSTDFNATHAGVTGTGNIGLWFDLDCQQIEIYGGSFADHPWAGIVLEGCNGAYLNGFDIDNSDGYGAANGEDFVLGALTIAESTNVTVEDYGILNSVRAVIIRQSNRSADWYNSNNASFVNYAWPSGPRYWLTATGPTPIPGVSDQSNMWSGNITFRNGLFTNCNRVLLNEGSNGGGMSAAGSLPLGTIVFDGNDYASSPGILFYDRSNTGLTLTQWQALPYTRDQ